MNSFEVVHGVVVLIKVFFQSHVMIRNWCVIEETKQYYDLNNEHIKKLIKEI